MKMSDITRHAQKHLTQRTIMTHSVCHANIFWKVCFDAQCILFSSHLDSLHRKKTFHVLLERASSVAGLLKYQAHRQSTVHT